MVIERKLIDSEYSKLIVLPKYWIEQHSFKRGDFVKMVITKSGNLLLMGKRNELP